MSFEQATGSAELGATMKQLQTAARERGAVEAVLEFRASLAADAAWAPVVSVSLSRHAAGNLLSIRLPNPY